MNWLFEAKKRFGLCILNYMVTSNHIHLLVLDTKDEVITKSIQLIAGRTGQKYNQRKNGSNVCEAKWSESIAVENKEFVRETQDKL